MISFITPTHNPRYLEETYASLANQTDSDWEWVLVKNADAKNENHAQLFYELQKDPRVKLLALPALLEGKGIGAIKQWSFMQGAGDFLAELDHDDLLAPTAVADLKQAFKETDADFVYSNTAEFFPNGDGHWFPYWQEYGWRYRDTYINDRWYNECLSFPPSAITLSLIYYSPNHIRCWKRDFYHELGGHNPDYQLCDDHELCIRTYLRGKMYHLNKLLYLYRMGEQNTFSKNIETIRAITYQLYVENLEKLIIRESELTGYPIFDLGGAISCPEKWSSVDLQDADVICNLNEHWPFKDHSVLAFRAYDIIEHLNDKQHLMSEIHRCLKPGGWALIQVPSTDGRGAFMDPTHVSYWNENSFWYYTRPEQAAYIRNTEEHFIEQRLFTFYPSDWHAQHKILYTKAELLAIKGDMSNQPGRRNFLK